MYLDYAVYSIGSLPLFSVSLPPAPFSLMGWKYVGTELRSHYRFNFPHHHQQLIPSQTLMLMLEIVEGCSGAWRKT